MDASVYHTSAWRELPRDGDCAVSFLFGPAVGPCRGLTHRHHVDDEDPTSRSFQVCASHHPSLQAALRVLKRHEEPSWRRCPHRPGTHRYPHAREACEAALNRVIAA
jgi:hypothetical protein